MSCFNNVTTQLYWNSSSTWWSPVDLLQHYIIKNLLKTSRRGCFQTTFFAWLSIKNLSSFYLINHRYIKDSLICYVCGLIKCKQLKKNWKYCEVNIVQRRYAKFIIMNFINFIIRITLSSRRPYGKS